jgi:hypothetical protein
LRNVRRKCGAGRAMEKVIERFPEFSRVIRMIRDGCPVKGAASSGD